jgi:hypothetical protein
MTWDGWRACYWTSGTADGWLWLARRALLDALPGAGIEVVQDPDRDVLVVTPPDGADPDQAQLAAQLAGDAIKRLHHATI